MKCSLGYYFSSAKLSIYTALMSCLLLLVFLLKHVCDRSRLLGLLCFSLCYRGIVCYLLGFFYFLSPVYGKWLLAVWAIFCVFCSKAQRVSLHAKIYGLGLWFVCVAAGFIYATCALSTTPVYMQHQQLQYRYSPPQLVVAEVVAVPKPTQRALLMMLRSRSIAGQLQVRRLRVSWFGVHPHIAVGQVWRLWLRLYPVAAMRPSRKWNNQAYKAWLLSQHIDLLGIVVRAAAMKAPKYALHKAWKYPRQLTHSRTITAHSPYDLSTANLCLGRTIWDTPLQVFRQAVAQHIQKVIAQPELAAFIIGLCVGVRAFVSKQQWTILSMTGTNHLIAIAGLHLGTLVFLSQFIFRRLPLWHRSYLLRPGPWLLLCIATLCALSYSLLAGFSLPTERAVLMLMLGVTALSCTRYISFWQKWLLAVFIIITVQPLIVHELSFCLSFTAVGLSSYRISQLRPGGPAAAYRASHSVLHTNCRLAVTARLKQYLIVLWRKLCAHLYLLLQFQFGLSLGLLPITLYFFHIASPWGIPANLIAVPLVAWLVLPLAWLGCLSWLFYLPLSNALLHLAALCLMPLWSLLCQFAGLQQWIVYRSSVSLWTVVLATCGSVLLLSSSVRWYWRAGALLLWCPLFCC